MSLIVLLIGASFLSMVVKCEKVEETKKKASPILYPTKVAKKTVTVTT